MLIGGLSAIPTLHADEMVPNETNIQNTEYRTIVNSDDIQAYNDKFMLNNKLMSITNNGRHYGNSTIDKAIDGDPSTHWETGIPNSDSFNNEVTITFDQIYEVSRIEYLARQSADSKGFPLHYKLYASQTESDDDFILLKEDTYTSSISSIVPIEFAPTDMRRVRLEFVEAKGNYASIAEISFYQLDPFMEGVKKAFTDKTYSSLNPAYASEAAIDALLNIVVGHPYEKQYQPILNDALELVATPNKYDDRVFIGEQKGPNGAQGNRAQMDFRHSLSSTGYYVTPGETITIYLEADPNRMMPKLVFGQVLTDAGGWMRTYNLVPGINVIKAEPLAIDDNASGVMRPAAIYLENQAYPDQQAYAPKFRVVGGTKFPLYVHGETNVDDFMQELTNYVANVENNDLYFDYDTISQSAKQPKFYNIMELVTENTTTTTSARGALAGLSDQLANKGLTIADTANAWERFYKVMNDYSGFVENDPNPVHHAPLSRMTNRLFNKGPHAWAGGGITGYQAYGDLHNGPRDGGFAKELVMVSGPGGGWGEAHEWGHNYDNWNLEIGEVTNNMYALRMEREFGLTSRLVAENRWNTIKNFNEGKAQDFSVFEQTAIMYQLEMKYGLNDFYPKVNRYLREESANGTFTGMSKWQVIAVAMSKVAGVDVTSHFTHYNLSMDNANVKALVKDLPVLQDKTWLITDNNRNLNTFQNNAKPEITNIGRFEHGVEMEFIIAEPANTVAAYEIYRDGKLLAISNKSTYIDTTAQAGRVYTYEIIAYDSMAVASPKSDKYVIRGKNAAISSPGWIYTADPVAQGSFPLKNAFDKNTKTFFETIKVEGEKSVTVDMQKELYIEGFSYVARPHDQYSAGMMKDYNFYVSLDGEAWDKVIDQGELPNPEARGDNFNNITLPDVTKARFVKLESLSVLHGDDALAIAELMISGSNKSPEEWSTVIPRPDPGPSVPTPEPTEPEDEITGGEGGTTDPIQPTDPIDPTENTIYIDVPTTHWAYEAINALTNKNIVNGVTKSEFRPAEGVTRAQFTTMIARAFDLPLADTAEQIFSDVPSNVWYAKSIHAAAALNIVKGTSIERFEPNALITREQIIVMLVRAWEYKLGTIEASNAKVEFADASEISDWAKTSVLIAVEKGWVQGKLHNMLDPKNTATRAESASMLYKALE